MRRLYSTFAGGWPGIGLLVMRCVAGSALVLRASLPPWNGASTHTPIVAVALAASGILLIAGLWTPLAGMLVVCIKLGQILTHSGDPWISLFLGTLAGGLAMLGPGRWSIDARLFGWKRVEAPPRSTRSNDS